MFTARPDINSSNEQYLPLLLPASYPHMSITMSTSCMKDIKYRDYYHWGENQMIFIMKPMYQDAACDISTWNYEKPYDMYNMNSGQDSINELLSGSYFAVLNEHGILSGFCCFGESAQVPVGRAFGAYPPNREIDVGIGMRPDLTGQGHGSDFFAHILAFMKCEFDSHFARLTVAKFNTRAIHLYEKFGFTPGLTFWRENIEFTTMAASI